MLGFGSEKVICVSVKCIGEMHGTEASLQKVKRADLGLFAVSDSLDPQIGSGFNGALRSDCGLAAEKS